MKGHVDEEMRALLPIRIGKRNATPELEIFAWLDTAFNGTIVLPKWLLNSHCLSSRLPKRFLQMANLSNWKPTGAQYIGSVKSTIHRS